MDSFILDQTKALPGLVLYIDQFKSPLLIFTLFNVKCTDGFDQGRQLFKTIVSRIKVGLFFLQEIPDFKKSPSIKTASLMSCSTLYLIPVGFFSVDFKFFFFGISDINNFRLKIQSFACKRMVKINHNGAIVK